MDYNEAKEKLIEARNQWMAFNELKDTKICKETEIEIWKYRKVIDELLKTNTIKELENGKYIQ